MDIDGQTDTNIPHSTYQPKVEIGIRGDMPVAMKTTAVVKLVLNTVSIVCYTDTHADIDRQIDR